MTILTLVEYGQNPAVDVGLSRGLCQPGDGDDGAARSVLAEQVGGPAARRDHHDGGRHALGGRFYCRDGYRVRALEWRFHLRLKG